MKGVDTAVKYLTEKLTEKGLIGCVNIILVSDHGLQYLFTMLIMQYIGRTMHFSTHLVNNINLPFTYG